eukprot:Gregarina_sp_Poly_1__265@NODE_1064_length_5198_cov_154_646658_g739_i0_p1_GENE_NODE_1064_length_5198_cov_154_646658_g739_i0NODE_1064_length_5198_cov_154_646658_g739_i0_p1_ORF_typecomplete_len639_score62_31_NODE_1064_length_5198_cov_154_646658_g739_i028444760
MQPSASSPCITTARTSPFALLEIAFLGISVALICSYKSETSDETILAQNPLPQQFLSDIIHGMTTGLSIFFATLACCSALHREFQYINGCVRAWLSSKGIYKWTANSDQNRLPGVVRSINARVLFALGVKTALILFVFNVVVPFLTLKASRRAVVQSASEGFRRFWVQAAQKIDIENWITLPQLQMFDLNLIDTTKEWLLANISRGLRVVFPPDIAVHTEEILEHTWEAVWVITMLLLRVVVPPTVLLLKVTWKIVCLAHLQGTILFPWMPYTYWIGKLAVGYGRDCVVSAWQLIIGLPHYVLDPWIVLTILALVVMTPVFASEALILKHNIGGATLPLLLSTLTANHVASLLIFDVVRVLASVRLFHKEHDDFDALNVIGRISEARAASEFFPAFQVMTAVSIALVVLAASNKGGPNPPLDVLLLPKTSSAGHVHDESGHRKDEIKLSSILQPTQSTSKRTGEKSMPMPSVRETDEEFCQDSENIHQPQTLSVHCESDTGDISHVERHGQSSNIEDSSGCRLSESEEHSDAESRNSPEPSISGYLSHSPELDTGRTEAASGHGLQEIVKEMPKSRNTLSVITSHSSNAYRVTSGHVSEGSTSSEQSDLICKHMPLFMAKTRSSIPERPSGFARFTRN